MAIEMRGSSGPYYYKKVREGDTVRSVYHGGGELSLLEHRWDEAAKADAAALRETHGRAFDSEVSAIAEVDKALEAVAEHVEVVVSAVFLAHGYREHSRSWRRRAEWLERK